MPKTRKKKMKTSRSFLSPKVGIPLIIIGALLLLSPLLSDLYANYQQKKLIEQHREAFAGNPGDRIPVDLEDGAPTGFKNVILEIPRLDVEVAVLEPPESFEGYEPLLRQGPVFYRESVYPGAKGNVAVTAHRIDHGNYFHDLDFLEEGDKIHLHTPEYSFTYVVTGSEIIDKHDMDIIVDHSETPYLLLVSCEPKHTREPTPLRIAVQGELAGVEGVSENSDS